MPTYDYRCKKCGHRYELFHSIKDDAPKRCPKCRGRAERVPAGGAGLLFKGSGFYITDYRSSSYKEGAKQEGARQEGAKSEGAKSEGGKSESGTSDKAGAKAEPKAPSKSGGASKPEGRGTSKSKRSE